MEQTHNPLFVMEFSDGSRFVLPKDWDPVHAKTYSPAEHDGTTTSTAAFAVPPDPEEYSSPLSQGSGAR